MSLKHTRPADIERASMEIITRELAERRMVPAPGTEAVVKRVIHTTADFDYGTSLRFTPGAVERGVEALRRGTAVITDTNMARAGVSKPALAHLGGEVHCLMAEEAVADAARARGTTRAAVCMEEALRRWPGGILAVGNAPTALLRIAALLEEGARPALVIGVPVGFVNVVESKERLLAACEAHGVPAIVALGRKGGSNVAAAICNALLYLAEDTLDPVRRGW
ncbi:precorrin-8X methylmutase [uncultured Oscillibacter sp.]|uniref:precorrin-8X methylmutase n=1 Tax=uncultured Oscillibacter sp. TaxID=876091 RepID=UPI0025DA35B2|nr:precorrin-8X methylmutase [uncultured Oscillibacter sp.]